MDPIGRTGRDLTENTVRSSSRRLIGALVGMFLVCVLAAPSAAASPDSSLTPDQRAALAEVLRAHGASPDQVRTVLADRRLALGVPVSVTSSESAGSGPGPLAVTTISGPTVQTVGSSCSGSQSWVQRIQYIRNLVGNELARYTMRTTFCHDGSRVTYASSARWANVTTLGQVVGIRYHGEQTFSETLQTWNGRTNGQVRTQSQAKFSQSPIRIGELVSLYPVAITYGRHDGTWATGGSCSGCSR